MVDTDAPWLGRPPYRDNPDNRPMMGEDPGQFLARMFEQAKHAPITYTTPKVVNPEEAAQIAAGYSALYAREEGRGMTKRGVLITLGIVALWTFAIWSLVVYPSVLAILQIIALGVATWVVTTEILCSLRNRRGKP